MNIKKYIKEIKDFPQKGILFRDIQPLLATPKAFKYTVDKLVNFCKEADIIVAPDARGFIFGTPVSMILQKPFVMVRKPGKLPGQVISKEYELEYGTNILEISKEIIKPGQKVAIVDDLLAIGGTTNAIIDLVKKMGGEVICASFVIELKDLKGREKIKDIKINSIIEY